MASASVVLKHETSTLRWSHNFISIELKFGVSDHVREVTSPATFGSDPISGRDATWGATYTGTVTFVFCFFLFLYSSTELQPIPVNQFSRTIAQKTRYSVRKTLWGCEMCNSEIWGCFTLKTPLKLVRIGNYQSKIKCRITPKRYEIREICQWTLIMKPGSLFHIPSKNLCEMHPSGEITWRHFRLAMKPRHLENHAS